MYGFQALTLTLKHISLPGGRGPRLWAPGLLAPDCAVRPAPGRATRQTRRPAAAAAASVHWPDVEHHRGGGGRMGPGYEFNRINDLSQAFFQGHIDILFGLFL